MKKILMLFVILVISSLQVSAYNGPALLTDSADLLTNIEEAQLTEKLELLSDKHGIDIAVMTSDTLMGYYNAEEAATELYEITDYEKDGVMLFISMSDRDWYILTSGSCINSITYNELGYISDCFMSDLSNGYYLDAFLTFAECSAEMYVEELYTDVYSDQYDEEFYTDVYPDEYEEGLTLGESIITSLIIGLVIALIATGIMRAQLKTVRKQTKANIYVKQGSMNVTESHDLFLYRNIVKHKRSSNSSSGGGGGSSVRSTHRSSSGRSYGGRGGKF